MKNKESRMLAWLDEHVVKLAAEYKDACSYSDHGAWSDYPRSVRADLDEARKIRRALKKA
jgi:hypothetical protein